MGPEWLFKDEFYRRCIELATNCKSDGERYGSILVKDGEIIGEGWNRFVGRDARTGVKPRRRIYMGYANHAEIEALNTALHRHTVDGAELYVAGYFAQTGLLNIREKPLFTCVRCIPYLQEHAISAIHTPMFEQWGTLTIDEAEQSAREFKQKTAGASTYEQRLTVGNSKIPLEAILR